MGRGMNLERARALHYEFALSFLAIALAMRVLADMPDPERAYGTRLTVELWSIGAFLTILTLSS